MVTTVPYTHTTVGNITAVLLIWNDDSSNMMTVNTTVEPDLQEVALLNVSYEPSASPVHVNFDILPLTTITGGEFYVYTNDHLYLYLVSDNNSYYILLLLFWI